MKYEDQWEMFKKIKNHVLKKRIVFFDDHLSVNIFRLVNVRSERADDNYKIYFIKQGCFSYF